MNSRRWCKCSQIFTKSTTSTHTNLNPQFSHTPNPNRTRVRWETRKQGSKVNLNKSKPRAQEYPMWPAALTSEGRGLFIATAQILPIMHNNCDFRIFRKIFGHVRKFQLSTNNKVNWRFFGHSENFSDKSENFQKQKHRSGCFRKSPKIAFGQVRKYTEAILTLLKFFGNSENQFRKSPKINRTIFAFAVIFGKSKNVFQTYPKISRSENWFCAFSESPKMTFGKLRKFPEHIKLRRNTFKNWFWALWSLLIYQCIIPLNSVAFLLTQEKEKVQNTICSFAASHHINVFGGIRITLTHWGHNNLHICLNKNVSHL